MKNRVIGTLLFGLGVFLIVVAVGLPMYVAPAATKLPYDLANTSSLVEAKNVTFLQVSKEEGIKVHKGDLRSVTEVVPQAKLTQELKDQFKDNAVVWDVYTTTSRADNGQKISQSITHLALERVSGAAADWDGAWVNEGTEVKTKFTGQVYKFPFHTEKRDYPFWDGERLDSAIPAKFKSVEEVGGLEVYVFEQVIENFKTSTPEDSIKSLLGAFAPTATSGEVIYSNTRTFWVEPTTGQYLNLRENRKLVLKDNTGGETLLLGGEFAYAKETTDNAVKSAGDNKRLLGIVGLWGPIGLGVLGLLMIVGGLFLRRDRQPKHAAEEL